MLRKLIDQYRVLAENKTNVQRAWEIVSDQLAGIPFIWPEDLGRKGIRMDEFLFCPEGKILKVGCYAEPYNPRNHGGITQYQLSSVMELLESYLIDQIKDSRIAHDMGSEYAAKIIQELERDT